MREVARFRHIVTGMCLGLVSSVNAWVLRFWCDWPWGLCRESCSEGLFWVDGLTASAGDPDGGSQLHIDGSIIYA